MRHARKCYNCGCTYSYCPNCSDDRNKPVFMATFHDSNCKDIFDTCVRFNMNLLTQEEAAELLSSCDLSNQSNFRADVQRDLKTIFAEKPSKLADNIEEPKSEFKFKKKNIE